MEYSVNGKTRDMSWHYPFVVFVVHQSALSESFSYQRSNYARFSPTLCGHATLTATADAALPVTVHAKVRLLIRLYQYKSGGLFLHRILQGLWEFSLFCFNKVLGIQTATNTML